jgi:hypothetical protein
MILGSVAALLDQYDADLKYLSQRAIFAVMSRSARRVLPVLAFEGEAPTYHCPVEGIIRLAERFAAGGFVASSDATAALEAIGDGKEDGFLLAQPPAKSKTHVRRSAAHLAEALRGFLADRLSADTGAIARRSIEGKKLVKRSAAAAALEALASLESVPEGMRTGELFFEYDRRRLATGSPQAFRRLGDPVDPSEEGPLGVLWPQGTPSWYEQGWQRLHELEPVRPAEGARADGPPQPSPQELFVASPSVAQLALLCRAAGPVGSVPDLTVTSRRLVPSKPTAIQHLDVVQEAIGERLVRLVSGLARDASVRPEAPDRVLISHDRDHLAEEVERLLARRLGLDPKAKAYDDFRTALAIDFYDWLTAHPELRTQMRGEFDGQRFYVRCPQVRRRTNIS